MAKQPRHNNYEQTDGGLWLPKYGLRGPDRLRLDSRRFMPGYPCCCGCVDKYYVNSVSGDQAETGSGTEIDPWINLNTPFTGAPSAAIYATAIGGECKVRVYVKGTIDYATVGNAGRNYQRNLEILPWDVETIEINTFSVTVALGMSLCIGCVLNHIEATATATAVGYAGQGFYYCSSSTFNNCSGTGYSISHAGQGFYGCSSSIFNTCIADGYGTYGYGFNLCPLSTFNNCNGIGTGYGTGYGFYACTNISVFDTCAGEGYVTAESGCRKACGFYANTDGVFSDCSTTDRICIDCGDCGSFTCDI